MHGVQPSQTLDQIYYNTDGGDKSLHTEREQVIYRWSENRNRKRKEQQDQQLGNNDTVEVQDTDSITSQQSQDDAKRTILNKLMVYGQNLWRRAWNRNHRPTQQLLETPERQQLQYSDTDNIRQSRRGGRQAANVNAKHIRADLSSKWLMIRQLWLWKLDNSEQKPMSIVVKGANSSFQPNRHGCDRHTIP